MEISWAYVLFMGLVTLVIYRRFFKKQAVTESKRIIQDEYTELRSILNENNPEQWKAYKETPKVSAWVKETPDSQFIIIKGRVILENTTIMKVLHAIWDVGFRSTWDDILDDFKVLKTYSPTSDMISYYAKSPMPFLVKHREFVQKRSFKFEDDSILVLFKNVDGEDIPIRKDCVRAETIIQGNVIRIGENNSVIMDFLSQNDVKGSLPPKLTNTFAPGKAFDWLKKLAMVVENVQ